MINSNTQRNNDSDQSISEDEAEDYGTTQSTISLTTEARNHQGGMLVLSELEMLKGCPRVSPANYALISSAERLTDLCAEEEVEYPIFSDRDDSTFHYHCNEESVYLPTRASILNFNSKVISDNKNSSLSFLKCAREDMNCTFSEVSQKAKTVDHLPDSSGHFSSCGATLKANISLKGVVDRMKRKQKFSFVSKPYMGEKNLEVALNRTPDSVGYGCVGDNDSPEAIDGGTSSDDELIQGNQRPNSIIPQTMADKFHETFGTVFRDTEEAESNFPRLMCDGLFEKLQQVIQREKETDMDQLKALSAKINSNDDRLHFSVRILSKSLEANLTVCSCISIADDKDSDINSLQMKTETVGKRLTIIFSPRICSAVDLEVGSIICIWEPWKNIQVMGMDEVIILCLYYF